MRIPPLTIKNMLESNPLKSIMLVRRLAVCITTIMHYIHYYKYTTLHTSQYVNPSIHYHTLHCYILRPQTTVLHVTRHTVLYTAISQHNTGKPEGSGFSKFWCIDLSVVGSSSVYIMFEHDSLLLLLLLLLFVLSLCCVCSGLSDCVSSFVYNVVVLLVYIVVLVLSVVFVYHFVVCRLLWSNK